MEAKETKEVKDVVFFNYAKDEEGKATDKLLNYQVYDGDKQYVAYPAPTFEAYDKEDKSQITCRIEPMKDKKDLKRFKVTVWWKADEEGAAREPSEYIAYQRKDKDKKPSDFFSVSNPIVEGGEVTFPKSTKDEPGPANFLHMKKDKNGHTFINATVEDTPVGTCFKKNDGPVYEVVPDPEDKEKNKLKKVQGASFRLAPVVNKETNEITGERFLIKFKNEDKEVAFYRKADGKAFKKMQNTPPPTAAKTAEAEEAATEAPTEAPAKKGRPKRSI